MITIRCTFPHSSLGQTGGNRWKKAKVIKKYRETVGWELSRYKQSLRGRTNFSISFAPPDNRRRDLTNAQMAFKAGIDAIADVTGIDDSKFRITWSPNWLPVVKYGAVFISFENEEIKNV